MLRARGIAVSIVVSCVNVRTAWATQGEGVDSTEMTLAMVVGGVVLVATPALIVVAAIVWYVKSERRRDHARRPHSLN